MSKLTSSDWNAIKWYGAEFGYTIKDMMVWPIVTFRDINNAKVDINISDIKLKYKARSKAKKGKVRA